MAAQVKTLGSRLGLMDNIVRAIAEHHRKTVKDIDGDGEFEIEALYREIIKIRHPTRLIHDRDWGQMGAFRDILGYRMAFRGSIPSTRAGNVQLHISYNLLACSVVKLYH